MRAVVKYRGGKSKEIKQFKKYIPNGYNKFFEPFVGGGAVFFSLVPQSSVINDINPKLMAFYRDLKDNYPILKKQLSTLQKIYEKNQKEYKRKKQAFPDTRIENKNESLYYEMREEFNHPTGNWLEGTTYFFINKTAYSGMIRYNSKGEFNVPYGRYANFNTNLITYEHHKLLQRTEIHNRDYQSIFELANADDFMFLDPPYDCIFNDYGNLSQSNGFDEEHHIRLAKSFYKLKCKALMVISKTDFIENLYQDYIINEYAKSYAVNIKNRFKSEAKHLIVANY